MKKSPPNFMRQHWAEDQRLPSFLQAIRDDLLSRGLNGDTDRQEPLPEAAKPKRKHAAIQQKSLKT